MAARQRLSVVACFLVVLAAAPGSWFSAGFARAAETKATGLSLDMIPADAAFYGASLRNREQIEAIGKTRAWAKLFEMPSIQMGLSLYKIQAANSDGVLGKFDAALKTPEACKAFELLADMFSSEVFVYGDQSLVDVLALLQELNSVNRFGPFLTLIENEIDGTEIEMPGARLMSFLAANSDRIRMPDMVCGFKVSNKELAVAQIAKLEELLKKAMAENPDLKGKLGREKVQGNDYLTLTFDGEMIPLTEEMIESARDMESEDGDVNKLVKRVKQLTCTIAVGMRGDYLLLSVGSSTDCLKRLGGKESLAGRDEMKPLAKFLDKRLTHVGYVAKQCNERLATSAKDIDDMLAAARQVLEALEKGDKITAEQSVRIAKDAAGLAEDIKRMLPQPGAAAAFSYWTEAGIESYGYDWTKNQPLDGTKPLSLLKHLGGAPMFAALGRGRHSIEDYDAMVKWAKTAYGYFEEFGRPQMDLEEREQFDKFAAAAKPLLARFDKANREMVLPALADGQMALVIDAKLRSKQFCEGMPEAEEPLPMAEPALVLGLSDSPLFVKGLQEYRAVANGLIDAMREIEDSDVPDWFTVPEAEKSQGKAGVIYSHALPEDWGLDKKITLNLGVSDDVAVFSISHDHTERLLASNGLSHGGVLEESQRPRAGAVVVDCAALMDLIKPWVDYGFAQSGDSGAATVVQSQVQTVLDVLKVFRTLTSEVYFEDGVLVSHAVMEIADIPAE